MPLGTFVGHPLSDRRSTTSGQFPSLPFKRFQVFLTLFPKFFSSFLRSTCSLSVSHQYLVLEEVYLPLGLKSQATRLYIACIQWPGAIDGALTLSGALFQGNLCAQPSFCTLFETTIPDLTKWIFSLDSSLFSRPYWGNLS